MVPEVDDRAAPFPAKARGRVGQPALEDDEVAHLGRPSSGCPERLARRRGTRRSWRRPAGRGRSGSTRSCGDVGVRGFLIGERISIGLQAHDAGAVDRPPVGGPGRAGDRRVVAVRAEADPVCGLPVRVHELPEELEGRQADARLIDELLEHVLQLERATDVGVRDGRASSSLMGKVSEAPGRPPRSRPRRDRQERRPWAEIRARNRQNRERGQRGAPRPATRRGRRESE